MHQDNYVHGDLHSQNIQVIDNSVCVLDFDWAGKILSDTPTHWT